MMFTLEQIQSANSKPRTGKGFSQYAQELFRLGVVSYNFYVSDGHFEYFGENHFTLTSNGLYPTLEVMLVSDRKKFEHILKMHQQGETDFFTFCKQAGESGIERWMVDMEKMTCTYYDKAGDNLLTEEIPK